MRETTVCRYRNGDSIARESLRSVSKWKQKRYSSSFCAPSMSTFQPRVRNMGSPVSIRLILFFSPKDSSCSDWPPILPVECSSFDWTRIECQVRKEGGIAKDCDQASVKEELFEVITLQIKITFQEDETGCRLVLQHRR